MKLFLLERKQFGAERGSELNFLNLGEIIYLSTCVHSGHACEHCFHTATSIMNPLSNNIFRCSLCCVLLHAMVLSDAYIVSLSSHMLKYYLYLNVFSHTKNSLTMRIIVYVFFTCVWLFCLHIFMCVLCP